MREVTMSARQGQSFCVGIIVALNLLCSVAQADPAASTAADPEKLIVQAEQALDREELDTAVKLYQQAAELNSTAAQVYMGEFANSAQFYEEAVGWFLMAASQGNAAGQFDLAQMYVAGTGIEKDEAKALYWFRRSADKNYLPAVKLVGNAYRLGLYGLKIDLEKAKSWDAKASRLEAIQKKVDDEKLAEYVAAQKKLQEEAAKKANK
jgi:TPR repeat protein